MLHNLGPVANSPPSWSSRPTFPESVPTTVVERNATRLPETLPKSGAETFGQGDESLALDNLGSTGAIQGGLGSINRWSESTLSSRDSLQRVDHDGADLFAESNFGEFGSRILSLSSASDTDSRKLSQADHPHSRSYGLSRASDNSQYLATGPRPSLSEPSKESPDPEGRIHQPSVDYSTDHSPLSQGQAVNGRHHPTRLESRSFSSAKGLQDGQHQGVSQKAILSKALQKANTAVLLDNAANVGGAIEAYSDACELLELVMLRNNGADDEKIRLEEIRGTYTTRIAELQLLDTSFQENDRKSLAARPVSQVSSGILREDEAGSFLESVVPQDIDSVEPEFRERIALAPETFPPRRQSLLPSALEDELSITTKSLELKQCDSSRLDSSYRDPQMQDIVGPANGVEHQSLRAGSPRDQRSSNLLNSLPNAPNFNDASTSWLDTIDESGPSSPSSNHSRLSSLYQRNGKSYSLSGGTEAEFDAALDAAVEAAYDDVLDPETETYKDAAEYYSRVSNTRKHVELAKRKLRETEQETDVAMTADQQMPHLRQQSVLGYSGSVDDRLDHFDEEAEEERLLDSIFNNNAIGDEHSANTGDAISQPVETKPESRVLLPPISDLTLSESLPISPPRPSSFLRPPSGFSQMHGQSVRARRLSGKNAKELKIETSARIDKPSGTSEPEPLTTPLSNRPLPPSKDEPQTGVSIVSDKHMDSASRSSSSSTQFNKRDASAGSLVEHALADAHSAKQDHGNSGLPSTTSTSHFTDNAPYVPSNLDRNDSNAKGFGARNVSVSALDRSNYPDTPSSSTFPALDHNRSVASGMVPVLPTPISTNLPSHGLPAGGPFLFDDSIHSPTSPGSPNPTVTDAPVSLEPCPESFLLRPFWLLRCIYQTVAHPRGGYLSTKLFIPRDVWRVRNVKIKAVEDKISCCDLLTAALLKLAQVDTYDADAVLNEIQTLESVFDQVQASLSKRLGNDVGVQGAVPLFKLNTSEPPTSPDTLPSRAPSGSSKSYLSSWRKLRSKNSAFGATAPPSTTSKEIGKDHLAISSLPMTSTPSDQSTKRTVPQPHFDGPNANYMGALARLCDAAQVVDQIARQVEDPGLKHSSQTLVGLELSTRHAAEFFGFYICRFVLNDIGVLLDKYIKRGSEWVLI